LWAKKALSCPEITAGRATASAAHAQTSSPFPYAARVFDAARKTKGLKLALEPGFWLWQRTPPTSFVVGWLV